MRAERSARVFRSRNKPRYTQIAIIRRFCRKLCYTSLPFEIFRRFKRSFHCIMPAERSTRLSSTVEARPDARKLQLFVDFVEN